MKNCLRSIAVLTACFLCFLFFPKKASAQVVINEFSSIDSSDWIEIANTSVNEIDLTGWLVKDTASSNVYDFSGNILPAGGYCFVSAGKRLDKDGDKIQLYNSATLVDCVSYGDGNGVFCESGVADVVAPVAEGETASRVPDGSGPWMIGTSTKTSVSCESLVPTPTPTPTPSATATPTDSPTLTTTSTPTPTPTKKATPKPTVKATSTATPGSEEYVLGLRDEIGGEESPTPEPEEDKESKFPWTSLFFIIPGLGLLGFGGYSFYRQKKGYTNSYEEKDGFGQNKENH